jgi:hypothetical protein
MVGIAIHGATGFITGRRLSETSIRRRLARLPASRCDLIPFFALEEGRDERGGRGSLLTGISARRTSVGFDVEARAFAFSASSCFISRTEIRPALGAQ